VLAGYGRAWRYPIPEKPKNALPLYRVACMVKHSTSAPVAFDFILLKYQMEAPVRSIGDVYQRVRVSQFRTAESGLDGAQLDRSVGAVCVSLT